MARVWDMRSRKAVHVLAGHKSTCWSVVCQGDDPQVSARREWWAGDLVVVLCFGCGPLLCKW